MSEITEPSFLLTNQYKDASSLNARAQLHDRFSINKTGWHHWAFDQLNLPPTCRILELGCGPGRLWIQNLERIPEGWDITLTDFSPGMLEEAQQNLRDSGRQFEFKVVDAQSIPYDDTSFDSVIANHMLYHVPDKNQAFAEICRVLRPGGRFYASTVGRTHMQELDELVSRVDPNGLLKDESINSFLLENGTAQIARWFSGVTLRRYEDGLVVTEAGPLIAYALSMVRAESVLKGDRLAEFIRYVEQELAARGAITITKDTGLFEAFRK